MNWVFLQHEDLFWQDYNELKLRHMNFWQLIFWPGKDFGEFEEKRIASLVNDKKIVGMLKWFNGNELNAIPSKFINNVKIGDIIFVHYKSLKFLVEVVSDCKECNDTKIDGWIEIYRDIEVLSTDDKIYNEFKEINKDPNFQWNKAYKPYISPTFGEFDTPMMHYCYNKIKKERNMEELKHLLKNNHNLILTGAPGTGKTYLAKQIAKEMGCSDDEIGFVQFHPSYDYTDFVEGLRPKKGEDPNSIGFEHKNGIFKEFCKNAIESQKTGGQDNFEEAWERLIKLFDSSDQIEINLLSGKNTFFIMLNSNGDGFVNVTNEDNKGWKQKNNGYFNHDQLYRIYKGGKGVNSGALDNYRKAIVKKMIVDCGLKEYKPGENKEKMPPYVFIIDEINRGEISKIFGELFFSIDPGYRGVDENGKPKGLVKTQYQNLVKDGDYFFDGFYIPENVYIIGTMNDIDRSVESMDFAFRRRFAFKEIKASENIGMLDELGDLKEEAIIRMNNLNNTIWDEEKKTGIDGLSSAYHIGGSYFLKLKNYDNNFEDLWNYHIEGLLREYLRGNPEIEKHISELKTAYQNNKKDVSSENNG